MDELAELRGVFVEAVDLRLVLVVFFFEPPVFFFVFFVDERLVERLWVAVLAITKIFLGSASNPPNIAGRLGWLDIRVYHVIGERLSTEILMGQGKPSINLC